jgi:hypothetical protein
VRDKCDPRDAGLTGPAELQMGDQQRGGIHPKEPSQEPTQASLRRQEPTQSHYLRSSSAPVNALQPHRAMLGR